MTLEIAIVFVLLAGATLLFITEWFRYDVTAMGITCVLLVAGILDLPAALSGVSSPATVAIASMFVLSAGLHHTGALRPLAAAMHWLARYSQSLTILLTLIVVGVFSGFVSNTAIVVLFIPVLIELAPRLGCGASQLLMPMSFIAIVGGVCTLIGTSTNLIVSSIAQEHGAAAFGFFELLPVGGALLILGLAYVYLGRRFLPERRSEAELSEQYEVGHYITDLRIGEDSSLSGKNLEETRILGSSDAIDVLEVFRGEETVPRSALSVLRTDDVLRVRGHPDEIARLLATDDLAPHASREWIDQDFEMGDDVLVEAVITQAADLGDQTLEIADFPRRYGAVPLAIRHRGRLEQGTLARIRLRQGDSLLLKLPAERISELRRQGIFVVSETGLPRYRTMRAPIAALIMLGVVLLAAFQVLPIAASTMIGCFAMVLTGCLRPDEVYEAIDWKIIMLLAGVIPLGIAMEQTDAARLIAESSLGLVQGHGPHLIIAAIFFLTAGLTNFISNAAAAALLTPLAIQMAHSLSVSPRPLVITVAFGASLAFLTPIGYQTNTLIYGPGQYRFSDYLIFGAPLTLLAGLVVVLLVPVVWPL